MAKKFGYGLMIPALLVALLGQIFSSYAAPWWAFISVILLAAAGASVGLLTRNEQESRSDQSIIAMGKRRKR